MEKDIYDALLYIMPALAVVVFIALFFIKAGYGMFHSNKWGISLPNKLGWVLMECPAFFSMLYLWYTADNRTEPMLLLFFALFELHYFQRSFIFPFLMRGKSRMPISIMLMGVTFNLINGFMLGEGLFRYPTVSYDLSRMQRPLFWLGLAVFVAGMAINLHSDHVIRNLRAPGDTRHYLPNKGMYRWVTSGNYFGELTEWTGFALLTASPAAWVFVIWTFANLAPRAVAIRRKYINEFGAKAVGNRRSLIPFIF